jgi:hypothetical protein
VAGVAGNCGIPRRTYTLLNKICFTCQRLTGTKGSVITLEGRPYSLYVRCPASGYCCFWAACYANLVHSTRYCCLTEHACSETPLSPTHRAPYDFVVQGFLCLHNNNKIRKYSNNVSVFKYFNVVLLFTNNVVAEPDGSTPLARML